MRFPEWEYNDAMRGIFATLLVALFSFSLISPVVFASDAESKLPACCRRGGKHHCEMMASQSESSSGPAVQAGRCGFFPAAPAIPASRTVSLPGVSQVIFAGLVSHPASRPQTEALCRISYSRAGQKRGPPSLL
jgi:hypothetical protein